MDNVRDLRGGNGNRPAPLEPPVMPPVTVEATLIINLMTDGNVTLTGPVASSMLCFGMLGEAHKILVKMDINDIIRK